MTLYLFLLLFFLILCLAGLWHFYLPPHYPPDSRIGAVHTRVQRLLKPRSPGDCPVCRLSSTLSSVVEPATLPVRPWRDAKSRRGAPKRVNTEGFACPNHQCPYFGITDAHVHALVGDGTHGLAERILGYRRATITAWLSRAGEHAQILHERSFRNLWLPHLQLDELRTRLRSYQPVLWLWLAIDPCTKILPVLHLGPRTHNVAHKVIHSLQ